MDKDKQLLRQKFTGLAKTYCGSSVKPSAIAVDTPEQFDALCEMIRYETVPPVDERKFLVTSVYGWGVGPTLEEAIKNCKRAKPRGHKGIGKIEMVAAMIHADCKVDSMTIEYPHGYEFRLDLGKV